MVECIEAVASLPTTSIETTSSVVDTSVLMGPGTSFDSHIAGILVVVVSSTQVNFEVSRVQGIVLD